MSYIAIDGVQQDLGTDWFGTIKKIGGSALDVVKSQAQSAGEAEAFKQMAMAQQQQQQASRGGTPKWLLPVGIGAAGLVLILVLKK